MNILIPMAGSGNRFVKEGYTVPKPLIEFLGKPMIQHAVESLGAKGQYIFVTRKYENEEQSKELKKTLEKVVNDPIILEVDYLTQGPACTCLLAKEHINNSEPLIITNCDQILEWKSKDFFNFLADTECDGIVVTYDETTEKNSYIKLDENGYGVELAEKKVISPYSLNGVHYWKEGQHFVNSAEQMIEKNIRTNNEFYISTSYNEMIKNKMKVGIYHINKSQHHPTGTPEDLKKYLKHEARKN